MLLFWVCYISIYLTKGLQRDERSLLCSAEAFSLAEVTEWLKLLNAAHIYDLSEKQAALNLVAVVPDRMEQVCRVWSRAPTDELTGRVPVTVFQA